MLYVANFSHETEIKLAVPAGPGHAASLLHAAGFAIVRPRLFEANTLVDLPGAPLRAGRQLLRVRECGGATVLTYKGPPVETSRHKSREEIEVEASDAGKLSMLLNRLGYQPVYRYEKFRTEFARAGEAGIATLDETPIGAFLELEGPEGWIDATALQLGYRDVDYITASYASLHRQYCESRGLPMGAGMLFERAETSGEAPRCVG